jgi:RimJ/RimL family protein N-acetyltransferase/REP element-mobilizing transposase RayT
MQKYDPAKHHRRSIRLKGYNYASAGAYFVTICVSHRHRLLGEIQQGVMYPSAAGKMVQQVWDELPLHYEGVEIDTFVVMPDHIHGIIILKGYGGLTLGDVVHRFKSFTTAKYRHGVKSHYWEAFEQRLWHRNYYEHIIRNERALQNIRRYIANNPIAWRKKIDKSSRPMTVPLSSDRLILRRWNPDSETEAAFEIYGDPEVMQWIGDGTTVDNIETLRKRLQQRNQQCLALNDGIGFWAIVEQETGYPIGTVILKRLPDGDGQPTANWEVGWHLRKASWGKGCATEAARVILNYGFRVLKLLSIYAIAYPENRPSIRVMERLGMKALGLTSQYYGRNNLVLYRATPPVR